MGNRTVLKLTIIIGIIGIVLGAIFGIPTIVNNIKNKGNARYSADNIVVTILDKTEATEKSDYYDGIVTAFKITAKNNSDFYVESFEGKISIYNSTGKELDVTNWTFDCNLESGEEATYTMNVDKRSSEEATELYYADIEDLSATFQLTKVTYEDYEVREYTVDPVSILDLSENSDGISTVEKTYQEALLLYNLGKYEEALEKFESLGSYKNSPNCYYDCTLKLEDAKKEVAYQNAISLFESEKYAEAIAAFSELEYYKDSHDKIQEVITAGIAKAEALANAGYYEAAYSLTQELYHDDFRNLVYSISKMCAYAKDFDFASAVEYGLKNVILPEGIEVIPARYFEGSEVESVVLPTTLKQIGEAAFKNCKHIKEIYLPHGLLTIEKNAFYGCTSLEKIEFSDTVTTIKDYAFRGCKKLTVVEIGNSVVSIGAKAFASCSNLASVTIPESVTGIASEAFLDCNKLVEVINHSRIPLTVGDSGNGYTAYYAIEVHTGESKLIEQDEYLFYSYDKINYLVGYAGEDTVLTLPDGYNGEKYVINDHAFQGESSITEVIISDFATAIGDYAFESCDGVRTLTVGNSVTHIGKYAFYDCTSIESLTLGDSVVSIGERAFQNCKKLASVIIPASVTTIDKYAFYNCSSLSNVTFVNTSGWYTSSSKNSASGKAIASDILINTSTAASYLTSNYYSYYWNRS